MTTARAFHVAIASWLLCVLRGSGGGGVGGTDGDLLIDLGPSHAPVRLLAFGSLEQYWQGESLNSDGENLAALCEVSTGCALWPAARVMVDFLRAHPSLFAGRRVLELGSGSGAVGLSLRRMGAATVELTDVAETLPLLRLNARRNGMAAVEAAAVEAETALVDSSVRVGTLQWQAPLPARLHREPPQLVVGSDIVYGVSEKAELPLVRTLARFAALRPTPPTIVLAMVDRGDAHAPFLAVAARHCFKVTTMHRVSAAAPPTEQGGKRNDAFVRRLEPVENCTLDPEEQRADDEHGQRKQPAPARAYGAEQEAGLEEATAAVAGEDGRDGQLSAVRTLN